jgi:hypothetical protein
MVDEKGSGNTPVDIDRAIVDEYYVNGFVGYKAVLSVNPAVSQGGAASYFHMMTRKPEIKTYMQTKVDILRSEAQISAVQVLRELIQFGFSDITDYMDLTVAEIKQLPSDVRRCIASYKSKTVTYLPRGAKPGEEVTETNVEIKLTDKIKAMEMINKHIGFYLEDNKQKGVKIDLSKATNVQLNMLLSLTEEAS